MNKSIALVTCLALLACGGAVVDVDGGADSGCTDCFDGGNPDTGPVLIFSCGTNVCNAASQICIHPCCGGAQICAPLEDGGACPPGLSMSQTCPPDSPCSNTCTPPPPYCGSTQDCMMPPQQGHDCYLMCQ